jgi:hypothetical protein
MPNPNAKPAQPFQKGQSGNPSGSSKERIAANKALAELLKPYEPKAIETLIDLMQYSQVDSVRLRAAEIIFDRVHGKAVQRMAGENQGEPITVIIDPRLAPIVRTDDEPTPAEYERVTKPPGGP